MIKKDVYVRLIVLSGKKLINDKKEYSKPILTIHGNVEKITNYAASGANKDAHTGGHRP